MIEQTIFNGTILREDRLAREWLSKLQTQFVTLNDRTKIHTLDIKRLEKEIKQIKTQKNSKTNSLNAKDGFAVEGDK